MSQARLYFRKSSNSWATIRERKTLFPDDFDEHALPPPSVKFTVENLLPRAEVEFAVRYGNDDFAPHDLSFQVSIGVILAGAVVLVLRNRRVWRQFFKPNVVIMQQTIFGIIYEYCRSDMHGIYQTDSLFHPTFSDQFLNRVGDIDESSAIWHFKPKMFSEGFHQLRFQFANPAFSPSMKMMNGLFDSGPTVI
jgi:hypothetical protein